MGLHKTEKPMFPKEFIWPAKMIHIATDTLKPLTALSQYAAQATSDPSVECRKRPLIAVFEILKPALKRAIHVHRNDGQTLAVATPGMGTNGVFEFPQTLLAGPPCAPFEVIAEKVKSLTWKCCIYHAGLLGMQCKTPFRDQLLHLVQGLACLRFVTAHNDKVSNAEEPPLHVLSEPGVNLSAHRAPIIQPLVLYPSASAETARAACWLLSLTNIPLFCDVVLTS